MSAILERSVRIHEHVSAEEVADLFWALDDGEQVLFFNRLAEISNGRLPMQLQYVIDCDAPTLTPSARYAMQLIGEYGS